MTALRPPGRPTRAGLALAAAAAALLLLLPAARAETLIPLPSPGGSAPLAAPQPIVLPERPALAPVLVPAPAEQTRPAPARAATAAGGLFLSLQGNALQESDRALLRGQEDVKRFTITLPAEAVLASGELVLSYQSSIEVLPERSSLSVALNGQSILETAPRATTEPRELRVPLPEGLLRVGPNEIVVSARQNHRLLCSVAGIYELWTAVDTARSGFEISLAEPLGPPSLATLDHALSSGLIEPRRVTFLAPQRVPEEAWLEDSLQVVQGIGRRVGGPLPELTLVAFEELTPAGRPNPLLPALDHEALPPGMLAVVGTASELRSLLPPALLAAVTGPYLGVHGLGRGDGSALLLFSGRDRDELRTAIDAWSNDRIELPARAGVLTTGLPPALPDPSRRPPRPIQGGETVTLGQLGVTDTEVWPLRQVIRSELYLPDDFFAANDAMVTMQLEAAYAPGLPPESSVNIFVNGRGAALVGLTQPQGGLLSARRLELPLRHFVPGRNLLDIEVTLPSVMADSGGFCPPGTAGIDTGPRFVLRADSSLAFPDFARLGQLPNLRLTADRGFPYVADGLPLPTDLYIGAREPEAVTAAMVFAASLARAARQRLLLRPTYELPDTTARNLLAIGPTSQFRPALFANAPLRQQDVAMAWSQNRPIDPLVSDAREIAAAESTGAALRRIETLRSGDPLERYAPFETAATGSDGEDWRRREQRSASEGGWLPSLMSFLPGIAHSTEAELAARRLLQQGSDVTAVMMQYQARNAPGRTITLVTAADSRLLLAAVRRLAEADYWEGLRGDLAVWGPDRRSLATAQVSEPYTVMTSSLSLGNLRLILSNWLSRHVAVLLASVLLTIVLLSSVTYVLLRLDRRRRDLA